MSLKINKDNIFMMNPKNGYFDDNNSDDSMANDFTLFVRVKLNHDKLSKTDKFIISRSGAHSGISALTDLYEFTSYIQYSYWFWDNNTATTKLDVKQVHHKIEDKDFKDDYLKKLKKIISQKKITEISSFEVEDKFFEKKISQFLKKEKINWNIVQTPMFLNSRDEFKNYLAKSKKPFMATFYKEVRKKSGILMGADGNPIGGKWSFDEDNRNKLPKDISIPKFPKINETNHTKKLKPIIEKLFKDHPGSTNNFWLATEYSDVVKLLDFFIKEKSNLFGDYEDAVNQKDNILFHSALSPYINLGLITPEIIVQKILEFHKKHKIRMNSLEGYVRQIIGWREFMRGIYQGYSDEMETKNFFIRQKKLKKIFFLKKIFLKNFF